MGVETTTLLVLAGASLALLLATLSGIWLGFRICTRDAALLARFAATAEEAKAIGRQAAADMLLLRDQVEAYVDQIERKRRTIATTNQKVQEAEARAAAQQPAAPPEPQADDLKARRRAIGRRAAS
jgi:hypothetical protein